MLLSVSVPRNDDTPPALGQRGAWSSLLLYLLILDGARAQFTDAGRPPDSSK